ncbi:dTDP-4-amino-4,6-dideoxyglucose formyltransferase [Cytobacillus sp. S13-E01]|uniref:dTDP-4-amino-4,6-dideoxyglucose formyltransferase n=1 Tax=Cytobacillus sp. S13-E01 TaxID=3031326 RepID=UPI0023D7EE22|nr:dTDP-4-amino-4,6-dideoxyglucose formyltransferase [Cytobacillus sp. S13-E01]MDF0727066.1 dTDP-4-amino-4,6-dideoxyglucose formyltransferase [Cytobacillus sp. S13-E01]
MKTLVITDNEYLYKNFLKIIKKLNLKMENFDFRYSFNNSTMNIQYEQNTAFKPINVREETDYLLDKYNIVISLHCKQLFPKKLVETVRCINIHPGYNPFNRGWFPQVFSIINGLPAGVTIHEIDEHLDHGNIITQKMIGIHSWETSECVYKRILEVELELIEKYLIDIIEGNYKVTTPVIEGNVNYKSDFNDLCKLDLNKSMKLGDSINLLRALTHGDYKNAFFLDEEGNKIRIKVELEKV